MGRHIPSISARRRENMTSEVMVAPQIRSHALPMTKTKLVLPLLVLIGFGAFSTWVAIVHGPLGFLASAGRDPWALQMLLDVGIACFVASVGLVRDARARGLPIAPYLVATFFLGSLGLLGYLVHRAVAARGGAHRGLPAGAPRPVST